MGWLIHQKAAYNQGNGGGTQHVPTALVTEEFIFSIKSFCRAEILEAACNRAVLFNIKT